MRYTNCLLPPGHRLTARMSRCPHLRRRHRHSCCFQPRVALVPGSITRLRRYPRLHRAALHAAIFSDTGSPLPPGTVNTSLNQVCNFSVQKFQLAAWLCFIYDPILFPSLAQFLVPAPVRPKFESLSCMRNTPFSPFYVFTQNNH